MPAAVEYLTSPQHETLDYESDPIAAMTSYSRMMHSHTKSQMDAATRSARRRSSSSSTGVNAHANTGLSKQNTHSSNSSRSSF
ncbi:hypothetical protein CLCR_11096 [Cladophialophora carrionii]|uniref:Uncharacterized protein n=1 Tax=Cladophialophora carrionii TaxID=86049 RepID=A0A1C1CVU2_9EURO|nr:hypothetical protein CLCR_11096 [Cladophialophora carrionii]